MSTHGVKKAFDMLSRLPRLDLDNIKKMPGMTRPHHRKRGEFGGKKHGYPNKGFLGRGGQVPAGWEGPTKWMPLHIRSPVQKWCKERFDPSYIPVTMKQLQLLLDTGRVDTSQPIDVTQLGKSGVFGLVDPRQEHAGFMLVEEGMDCFSTAINLEVQHASETAIAAVERAGGTITTAYYDPYSLSAALKPLQFFKNGLVIPKRQLPLQGHIEYYSDPRCRGYLADPHQIAEQRFLLSQKYGYPAVDLNQSPIKDLLMQRKDPRQVFHGLEPGWVVNLQDKTIFKPKDPLLKEYYNS